jgi:hypothetical protein
MSLSKSQYDLLKKYKLMIYNIDPVYTADYIIEVLYILRIAKVSRIITVPYISQYDGEMYMTDYIDVHEWNKHNYAQEFIKMLESPLPHRKEVYLYHYNNLGWPVRLITNSNIVFKLEDTNKVETYYNLKYYDDKNINFDNNSEMMAIIRTEFISKQCAENILNCE